MGSGVQLDEKLVNNDTQHAVNLAEKSMATTKAKTPKKSISKNNIQLLNDCEEIIRNGIVREFTPKETVKKTSSVVNSIFSYFYSYVPQADWIGGKIGGIWGATYGEGVSNKIVEIFVRQIFPNQKTSWADWITGRSTTIGLQNLVTPYLKPLIGSLAIGTGSIVLPAMVILAQKMYSAYTEEEIETLSHKKIEELFVCDPKTGQWSDAFGNPIRKKDIEEVHHCMEQLEIINQLKELDESEVERFFKDRLINTELEMKKVDIYGMDVVDQSGKPITVKQKVSVFHDGTICTAELMNKFKTAIKRLTELNCRMADVATIGDVIEQIAIHNKRPKDKTDRNFDLVECHIATEGLDYSNCGAYEIIGYCDRNTGKALTKEKAMKIYAEWDRLDAERINKDYNLRKVDQVQTISVAA